MGVNALIGSSSKDAKLYNVGDKLPSGEEIVKIRCGEIVLEKDGKQRTECVFAELKSPAQPGAKPSEAATPLAGASPEAAVEQAPGEKVPPAPTTPDEGPSAEPETDGPTTKEARAGQAAEIIEKKLKEREVRGQ